MDTSIQASKFHRFAASGYRRLFAILVQRGGQDLIEYALMAGFVAVSAGAIMPDIASNISTIFSKVGSVMYNANTPFG